MARQFSAKLVEAGLSQARAAFKALPVAAREDLNDATEDTAIRILAGARQRVAPHRRYGFLERYLAYSINTKTGEGKVGLPRRAAVIPGGASPSSTRTATITRRRKTGSAKGARVIYPSKYAHLVEFGHGRGRGKSSAPASPFMIPAAESERQAFLQRCKRQGPQIERDLSVSRFR
jgi:hypothetical protein